MSDPREPGANAEGAPPEPDEPPQTPPVSDAAPKHETGGNETGPRRWNIFCTPKAGWIVAMAATAAGFFSLVVLLFLLVSYFWPAKQSFQVEVITRGAEIGFDGGDIGTWRLPSATVCLPIRPGQMPALPGDIRATSHPECHTDHYLAFGIRNAVIQWPAGATIRVRTRADNGLSIDVTAVADDTAIGIEPSGARFGRSSRILIDAADWERHPSLPFSSGHVVLGLLPAAGEEGLLQAGRYQIRETLPFRSRPITVDDGSFFAGDQIRFQGLELALIPPGFSATGTYFAYGFLAPGNTDDAGYKAVAYTALNHTRLDIGRIGAEDSSVNVTWTNRALRDPLLLALTALLGVFGMFFPVVGILRFGMARIRAHR